MNLKNTPALSMDTIKNMEDMSFFTHAQIFDDLLVVAQKETCCFVYKTAEGLVIFDAVWPDKRVYDAIISAIRDIGWNPNDIKKLIFTHGHCDHTGCGKWFVKNYNVKTYLSKTDDIYWKEHPTKPDSPETFKDFDIDCYISGGDKIDCGDKEISVYSTPGHTPGCLSYIFPVFENNEKHIACIFGGMTPPWGNSEGAALYISSLNYFEKEAQKSGTDVILCNHTAFDNGLARIAYSKTRLAYLPNIYILTPNEITGFFSMLRALGEKEIK